MLVKGSKTSREFSSVASFHSGFTNRDPSLIDFGYDEILLKTVFGGFDNHLQSCTAMFRTDTFKGVTLSHWGCRSESLPGPAPITVNGLDAVLRSCT